MCKIKYSCPRCGSDKIIPVLTGSDSQYITYYCIKCLKTPVKNSNTITLIGAKIKWNNACKELSFK